MYTSLNVRQMIEAVKNNLHRNILPHVSDPKAKQDAEMCVAILQWAQQLAPVEQQLYGQESKEMIDLFANLGNLFEMDGSPEGQRIRDRAKAVREMGPVAGSSYEQLLQTHRELSKALIPTLDDLHAVDAQSDEKAVQGLAMIRVHLARRSLQDLAVYLGAPAQSAMVGREGAGD